MTVAATAIEYPAGYGYPVASAARHLLNTIVETYERNAEVATALPLRQLVTIGSVSVDAPLVAVMYGGIAVGPPGNELNIPYRIEAPRSLTFNVELWRETPTVTTSGHAPSTQAVSAAAEVVMQDSWLLLEAAFASDQTGVGVIANAAVNAPQGGMIGVSMSVEQQVP